MSDFKAINAARARLARRIARDLFTDGGTGKRAKRLVLKIPGTHEHSVGWCQKAVADRIAAWLNGKLR